MTCYVMLCYVKPLIKLSTHLRAGSVPVELSIGLV